MATKKYMSLERLQEYDALIKQEIADSVSGKANASHTHDDRYYTETEIDTKLSAVNTSITNITSGTTVVKKAEYATTAGSATSADTADEATHATSADTATKADSATTAETATHATSADSATTAGSATKATQDGNGKVISSTYETKTDAAAKLTEAKSYADSAATKVKNDLLNGAGTAYDTLKELGDLIDDNKDAIDALEEIASGKANATHTHAIADVTGLQSALDGKAAASHGTHVTFDSTNKPKMDGTAAFGTSTSVARADHVHPTDTSRAAKTELDALAQTVAGKADSGHTHSVASASANGFMSSAMFTKLSGIAEGANKTVVDTALSTTSTNPVQNKVVNSAIGTLTSTVSANTQSISSHTTAIQNLQTAVGEITEITSAEIQSLFA